MSKITPFLWFDTQALEAMKWYVSLFPNSSLGGQENFENTGSDEQQTIQVVSGNIAGLEIQAMNAGPLFQINPSISFFVKCQKSSDVDRLYEALQVGGKVLMEIGEYPWSPRYGWVSDRFGVSWQLIFDESRENVVEIIPCLLFTQEHFGQAEAALQRYTGLFKNSSIQHNQKFEEGKDTDKIMYAECTLDGSHLILMDGPGEHDFTFNEGVSLVVDCADQAEVDHFWDGLIAGGGEESQCGWLRDFAGVSWQIVPRALQECMSRDRSGNVMKAMLGMRKLIVADLEKAVQ